MADCMQDWGPGMLLRLEFVETLFMELKKCIAMADNYMVFWNNNPYFETKSLLQHLMYK